MRNASVTKRRQKEEREGKLKKKEIREENGSEILA